MKTLTKTLSVFAATFVLCCAVAWAQSFNLTNTFVMQQEVQVVQSIDFGEMIPVVTGAGQPVTNFTSTWGPWIPNYMQ